MNKCEYCQESKQLPIEDWDCVKNKSHIKIVRGVELVVTIVQEIWHEHYDSGLSIIINYCPICGCKLKQQSDEK